MINNVNNNIDKLMTMFQCVGRDCSYKKICELTEEEKKEYSTLLSKFKETNSSKCSTNEKGKALEKLATFVLNSAHIFDIYENIRTESNELDQLIKINDNSRILTALEIIDKRLKNFIGECKNYKGKVSVTYVGKICSLLSTTNNKICILFSYQGITGDGWSDASGLIKKFYLSRENEKERFCIIDFNIRDFEDIEKGNNFLQIIEDKICTLQNDTDYNNFIVPHELVDKVNLLQKLV